MVYIVYWVLSITTMASCPDAGRQDDFGRVSNSMISCAVMHTKTELKPMQKEFANSKEAHDFYSNALVESARESEHSIWSTGIQDVKIDSLKSK